MENKSSRCIDCPDKSCAVAVLNEKELEWMSGKVQRVVYEKGENLFHEGTLNGHIFYLKRGLVKLHMKVTEQKDFILKVATAPCFLGLSTIFGDRINRYSATALEPSRVCMIDVATFNHLILHNGPFAYEILADICKDDLSTYRRYVQLIHKQTPGRLAGVLLFFSKKVYKSDHYELPLDRSELAEFMGLSREIVTRTLMQFREDGLIDIDKKHISILKPMVLMDIYRAG
ncbi:MAG: Crp/Fnr family transcriptional regulator [Lewinellaceae bacterium]|nr:Crp/Fnr family transcriptional regulator [Lewinellaceae bacterium]